MRVASAVGIVALAMVGCESAKLEGGDTGDRASSPRIRTAIYVDEGARNNGAYRWLELTACSPQLDAYPVDAAMIRDGALDRADVLVMPGGSSVTESETLGSAGGECIRQFVKRGGGYIGTCAGCFLVSESSESHPNMLNLIPYTSDAPEGRADMHIRFNARSAELTGVKAGVRTLRFAAGPVMVPSAPVEGANFEVLATYDSDVNPCGEPPREPFVGKAAVVAGTYGKGRVFASAVHPEHDPDGQEVLRGAFRFVTGRKVDWQLPQRKRGQLIVGVVTPNSFGVRIASFLQEQIRRGEFDLLPVNRESFERYIHEHIDAVFAPRGLAGLPLEQLPVTADPDTAVAEWRRLAALPPQPVREYVPAKDAKPIRVACYAGRGGAEYYITSRLARSPHYTVTPLSGQQIADGALKDFDLLVQPGGGCRTQCLGLGDRGCSNIVDFVRGGGKYYGVCAGAFMASQIIHPEFLRLGFVPYKDEDEPVYRGGCPARMQVTADGRKVFRNPDEYRTVFYNGGPVFVPGDPLPDTDVRVLMTFDCENISTKSPKPVMSMRGKGAFLGGRVGKGKVFVSAPHPEGDYWVDDIVDDGIASLTGVLPDPLPRLRRRGQPVLRFKSCSDREANDYYLNRLLGDTRFDVRTGASGFGLLHADIQIVTGPERKELEKGEIRRFARRGGTVILVADTEKRRQDLKGLTWATVVTSYDALSAELDRLAAGFRQ